MAGKEGPVLQEEGKKGRIKFHVVEFVTVNEIGDRYEHLTAIDKMEEES